MELAFSKELILSNGRKWETNFEEKILSGLYHEGLLEAYKDDDQQWWLKGYTHRLKAPKLHTIRRDLSDRWKPGNTIRAVTGSRSPKRNQFAPVFNCISTQRIEIRPEAKVVLIESEDLILQELNSMQIQALAICDGFPDYDTFWEYFSSDFEGKIIHWTNLKY